MPNVYTVPMHHANARFWTSFGIVSAALLSWLAIDYLSAPPPPAKAYAPALATQTTPPVDVAEPHPVLATRPPPEPAPHASTHLDALFKCVGDQQVSYSDQPCAKGEKTLIIEPRLALAGTVAPAMPPATSVQPAPQAPASATPAALAAAAKTRECADLLAHIARLDAQARLPHGTAESTRLAEDRRAASNRRFDLDC